MSTIIVFWVFEGKADDEGAVHGVSCMRSQYVGDCDKKMDTKPD